VRNFHQQESEQATVRYGGVELKLPVEWEDRSVLVYNQTSGAAFEPNFSIARIPLTERKPLDQVVRDFPLSDSLDCLLVLSRDYRENAGRPVFERIYRFVEPYQGTVLQQAQRFIMLRRGNLIILTLTTVANGFDSAYAVFDRAGLQIAAATMAEAP
jgi:hypothetical protein